MKYRDYKKTLLVSYIIVDTLIYPNGIKDKFQAADRINKAGDVNSIIIATKNKLCKDS